VATAKRASRRTVAATTLIACALVAVASVANAQDIEPRAYSNAPVGVNFLIGGYAYTRGGLAFDTSLPIVDVKLQTSNAVVGYARVLDLWGKSAKFDVIVPYVWLSGSASYAGQPVERIVNGFANPALRLSVNLYGAPALSFKEFRDYRQDLIVGASLRVSVPWGQYDDTRVVNIGANRWSLKPEVGVSKAMGPWTLEVTGAATLFTDNNDFYGGSTRSQKPLYSLQAHAIYGFSSGVWASGDATWFAGGADHARRGSRQRPAAELAARRHARPSHRHPQLGQALREQRRVGAHGQQLRPGRDRLAVPLGRRALIAAGASAGTRRPPQVTARIHGVPTTMNTARKNSVMTSPSR